MGLLASLHHRAESTDRGPLSDFWYAPAGWARAFETTGIRVTPELALTLSALWHGTTFFARNMGSLPCITYRNLDPDGKERAKNIPLYSLFKYTPNAEMDAFGFWELAVGHLILRGNFYARIVDGPRGMVDQLVPIHPDRVTLSRLPSGRLQYKVTSMGQEPEYLTPEEVFHVRGFSTDGLTGLSVVSYAAQSLGTALAADTYAGKFFKSGATAALAVKHPGVLGADGLANLRESIKQYLYGAKNVGGVLVLEENASIEKIGVSPQDAQILATRAHSVKEVAHWLGLPMQIFADGGATTTYASAYQFRLDLVDFAFRPMAVRIEQAIRRQLIVRPDQYFVEFLVDAILRGDLKARSEFYHFAILDGWMTRNEVRVKENLNPDEAALDRFLEPGNMRQAGARPSNDPRNTGTGDEDDDAEDGSAAVVVEPSLLAMRANVLALEAARRVIRKEQSVVAKKAVQFAGDAHGWASWLKEFYADHAGYVAETLHVSKSIAEAYAAGQGKSLESRGLAAMEEWDAITTPRLASLALTGGANGHSGPV